MLPFIFALIFAVGMPFLPSGLYRTFHLPTLRFNFLSARFAPEQVFVPPPDKDSQDLDKSVRHLVFPFMSSPNCLNDAADAPTCTSLSLSDYPQSSIWDLLRSQLLYQLAEAIIIMTLSFFVATALLPRRCLPTLMERLCTALFLCWQYNPKTALSSFLQDVFYSVHRYWMGDSVSMSQVPGTQNSQAHQAALEVLADISARVFFSDDTTGTIKKIGPDPVASKAANLCSHSSSSIALGASSHLGEITPPRTEINTSAFGQSASAHSTITLTDPSHPSVADPAAGTCGERSLFITSSPCHGSSRTFLSVSMKDLYNSSRLGAKPTSHAAPSVRTIKPTHLVSLLENANSVLSLEPEKLQTTGHRKLSLEIYHSRRRRFKSDGIQVRAAHCRLGEHAAPLDPAKVDVACAFWKTPSQHDDERVQELKREGLAPGFFPTTLLAARLRRNSTQHVAREGGPIATDAALAGIVVAPNGDLIIPASQRPDGSMRKEIRVRPGHPLREPLAEKYRPPAARRRTPTWGSFVHEVSASPPPSPYGRAFPSQVTPVSMRQKCFLRQGNSPACLSDNWRRSSSSLTMIGTPSATEKVAPMGLPTERVNMSPATVESRGPDELPKVPAPTMSVPQALATRTMAFTKALEPILSALAAKQAEASNPMDASAKALDSRTSQGPVAPSSTPATLNAGEEDHGALQDIPTILSVPSPKAVIPPDCPSLVTAVTPATSETLTTCATDVIQTGPPVSDRDADGTAHETIVSPKGPPCKRKPSGQPHVQRAVKGSQPSDSPVSHRRPRPRRSAPHLGKQGSRRQEQEAKGQHATQTQTPEVWNSKRRRMRTASVRGTGKVTLGEVDLNGQIVLPDGTGWKSGSSGVARHPQQHHQKEHSTAIITA
ncbi:hypothetical protein B0F90DRAFT_1717580 [Multifurca ochricompacta]|uniref:WIBG Mago-binding domain-containing protein n=1 Tax=Multifurca ochricompacta TaxID=376703 RepID=A0AAD4M642_9AGAM|nr:hypothetical protein B0F90DRAFT_1717580 [Multifurca ochricompacta]